MTVFAHRDYIQFEGAVLPPIKKRQPGVVPGAVAAATSTQARVEYEVNPLSVIWLAMTLGASGIILFEVLAGYAQGGFLEVASNLVIGQPQCFACVLVPRITPHIHAGFRFDVTAKSEEATEDLPFCSPTTYAFYFFKVAMEIGVVVAEAALPTAQCCEPHYPPRRLCHLGLTTPM